MIDLLSADFIDLEQAVARLATNIPDQEVDEEQRRQKKGCCNAQPCRTSLGEARDGDRAAFRSVLLR